MKRNVLLFISLCVVGCVMTYAQQMPGLLQKGKADTQDCKAWVDEQLSEMSLKEKIGQNCLYTQWLLFRHSEIKTIYMQL